jgi:hypothetical protein
MFRYVGSVKVLPFSSLQIADRILLNERVPRTDTCDDTRCKVISRGFTVRLTDSMEIGTTADGLRTDE